MIPVKIGFFMRNMIVILLMVVSVSAFGEVILGTLHEADAQEVDSLMMEYGAPHGSVKIVYHDSTLNYAIEFDADFDWEGNDNLGELCAFIMAVADVSADDHWQSHMAILLYESIALGMSTEHCRTLAKMLRQGDNIEKFIDYNLLYINREELNLNLRDEGFDLLERD